jgi:hypothetical protein
MDAQAQSARAKTLSEKKNELIAKLKEKGVKDNEWIDSFVGEISITEDLDVEAKADAYLKLYNKGVAKTDPTPTPIPPRSGDTDLTDPLKLASQMAKQQREQNKLNNL